MGFPENRARKALQLKKEIQPAMDWLLQHSDDADIDEPLNIPEGGSATGEGLEAKSYKCEDCGKILRDAAAIELHAHRTGHENFAESVDEIKPLTEEEKKEKLAHLKAILQERKKLKQVVNEKDEIEKERERRKSGREGREAQKKYVEQQHSKELEKQKKEREEEKAYAAKVKAQLEQDKLEKLARRNAEQQQNQQQQTLANTQPEVKKEYTECRVQFRLPNNSTVNNTFQAEEKFENVLNFLIQNQNQPRISLMTTFPRKVYGPENYQQTLKELGLLPSCSFICKFE